MVGIWKKIMGRRDPDPQAVAQLAQSEAQLEHARSRSNEVNDLAQYLATRREQNHFGDAIDISFTPRRRHA